MGLDMYLQAQRRKLNEPEPDDYDAWKAWRDVNQPELGCWRKANAIHAWFVDNLGGGVDECQPIPVDLEQLLGLKALCEDVLADPFKAPEKLPTRSGFFFGDTEYGEWYLDDLRSTVDNIDKAVAFFSEPANMTDFELVYQASW